MDLKVSIIVLNYNGLSFLKPCLESIESLVYKNLEVIVTDNASTDGSIEYVSKLSGVKLVNNSSNLGYTGANNVAALEATGDFLLFLNNDTTLYPDFITE